MAIVHNILRLDFLKPARPEEPMLRTSPLGRVIVTKVLLNDALMCAMHASPLATGIRTFLVFEFKVLIAW